MPIIYERLLLAKIEGSKGTDAVPTAAQDAVRTRSFKVKKVNTVINRPIAKQTMGEMPHLIGKETVSIEIVAELRGSGAAGTAPEISPLLQACRTTETVVASTSVTYKPSSASASEKSCTIYAYTDGLLWKLVGAVGTAKIEAQIDGICLVTFSMQAAYVAPTVVSVPSGAVYDSTQPIIMTSSTVISDGATIKSGKFSLDFGNDVQNHYVTGENSFVVADRKPSTSFSKDSLGTTAEWTALSAATSVALSAAFGATAGNICTITAPVARRNDVGYGERAERVVTEISYSLFENTSDDQFSIAFT